MANYVWRWGMCNTSICYARLVVTARPLHVMRYSLAGTPDIMVRVCD
jgi:hypothetical protein